MSLFQSNLRKQIRNLPKILNFVKKITIFQNYSLHSLGRAERVRGDARLRRGRRAAALGPHGARPPRSELKGRAKFGKISKLLQIFGGLVLGCIKTKFCKKICVRQHFSSSTRFASFCTAAISKISQKNRFEKTAIFVKFQQKNCKFRKFCKMLSNFKNFSLRIW